MSDRQLPGEVEKAEVAGEVEKLEAVSLVEDQLNPLLPASSSVVVGLLLLAPEKVLEWRRGVRGMTGDSIMMNRMLLVGQRSQSGPRLHIHSVRIAHGSILWLASIMRTSVMRISARWPMLDARYHRLDAR